MTLELKPEIKEALIEMDFVEKYKSLSEKYSSEKVKNEDRLIYYDIDEVIDTIKDLGYDSHFEKKEKFFQIEETHEDKCVFNFNIGLDTGMADFVWVVKYDGDLKLGSPWSIYSRLLIDSNYRIKKPIFSDYEDLEEILKIAFSMYEEFKTILLTIYDR